MTHDTILAILNEAKNAPSGDNTQPWQFIIDKTAIHLFNEPEKDNPLFNVDQRGSHIGHGALIENISLVSAHYGYHMTARLFPDPAKPDLVATLSLQEMEPKTSPLYNAIAQRTINRKPYAKKPLTGAQNEELRRAATCEDAALHVHWIEDQAAIKAIGRAVSVNEIVMLEYRALHDLFFNDVRWTDAEEQKHKTGLYVKTMELAPPQLAAFKILKNWSVASTVNRLGVAKFVASQNAKIYGSAAAMCIITVSKNAPEHYIATGRLMERIWLAANGAELSAHPITGILYLYQRIATGDHSLSSQHVRIVTDAYHAIQSHIRGDTGTIAMLLRIGYGGQPSARSSKLPIRLLSEKEPASKA